MTKYFLTLIFMLMFSLNANAAPEFQKLPPHIFKWVQSSERAGYWFNQTEIYYGVNKGIINTNIVTVPIIKIYDDVQINEVKTKRRWHDQSLAGYEILTGAAEYLEFNLADNTVLIRRHDDLDNTWTVLSSEMPNRKIYLNKMGNKNIDKNFYNIILDYINEHKDEIMARSLKKGKLPEQKSIEKSRDKKDYKKTKNKR